MLTIKLTAPQAVLVRMILTAYECNNHIDNETQKEFKAAHSALTVALQDHMNKTGWGVIAV